MPTKTVERLLVAQEKRFTYIRGWLRGKEMFQALKAAEFSRKHHSGFRKDGFTPVFHHPLSVVMYLATLHDSLMEPELCYTSGLLHDIGEDTDVAFGEISSIFSSRTAQVAELLTKKKDGIKKSDTQYYSALGNDPVASIVKGADRGHNQQTMLGVFTPDKMRDYLDESSDLVLPMLKQARRQFPEQYAAYINCKMLLINQMEWCEAWLAASGHPRRRRSNKRK